MSSNNHQSFNPPSRIRTTNETTLSNKELSIQPTKPTQITRSIQIAPSAKIVSTNSAQSTHVVSINESRSNYSSDNILMSAARNGLSHSSLRTEELSINPIEQTQTTKSTEIAACSTTVSRYPAQYTHAVNTNESLCNDSSNNRLMSATQRAMSPVRVFNSEHVYNDYIEQQERRITIKPFPQNGICSKESTFHRLLESIAINLEQKHFISNRSRINLVFTKNEKTIEFSIGLYRNNNLLMPQVHIYKNGKMIKYEDLIFVKNHNKQSKNAAMIMNDLLYSTMRTFQPTLDSFADNEIIDDVITYLVITHIAECYRPGKHGPLNVSDCSKPSKSPEFTTESRILSRTPGVGKLTRSHIGSVIRGESDFSIAELKENLSFVDAGGTALTRNLATGQIPMTSQQMAINRNMSESSALEIITGINQLHNAQTMSFDVGIHTSTFVLDICKNSESFFGTLHEVDTDIDEPVTCSQIQNWFDDVSDMFTQKDLFLEVKFGNILYCSRIPTGCLPK